jgi:phospholipid-binding lipoprotein MlaA
MSLPPIQHLASSVTNDEPKTISDPNEEINRAVFDNNQKFNHAILYPVAKAYNENVPQAVRDRIDAFSTNLSEPMVFANDILQLRPQAAATTFGRFAFNSTIGLGGLFDVAAAQGLNHQSGDFGQTMYLWGYRDSAYLVLPVVGPTNVRDAIGSGIEFAAQLNSGTVIPKPILSMKNAADFAEDIEPVTNAVDVAGTITGPLANISKAEDMQALEESSIDFYSMLKSFTAQKRQAELQEALDTSALTSAPPPPDPNAIEPVTTLVSSPTIFEERRVTDVPRQQTQLGQGGTIVVIGPPTPVQESVVRQ